MEGIVQQRYSLIGLIAGAVLIAGPTLAQNLLAKHPDQVMVAMQNEGFLVTRDEADDGTPRLTSKVSDSEFRVYFYGCETGGDCTSLQFSAGYDLDNALSSSKMNQWNTENRYSRALIDDEGDPFIRMDLVMYGDGMGTRNFAEVLDIWRLLIEDFEDFIDW